MQRKVCNTIIMGSACSMVGLLTGLFLWKSNPHTENNLAFCVSASIAAFISGASVWWVLIEKAGPSSMIRGKKWMRGAIVGAFASPIGHFICLLIFGIYMSIKANNDSIKLLEIFYVLPLAVLMTLWSLVFVGFVTTVAGALVGGILATLRLQENSHNDCADK